MYQPCRTALTALALAASVVAAGAQESLTPEAFLGLAEGRTLTFVDGQTGALVGIERFLGDGQTIWSRADGTCTRGVISVRGPELCFEYEDDAPGEGPHCWWPLRDEPDLFVRAADAEREILQRVSEISEEPLECPGTPFS